MTTHSSAAFIVAARRTAVVPRDGVFRHLEIHDLAGSVIGALLKDSGVSASDIGEVIFGNALYGGGNPARMAALAAGLPDSIPALTVDTQCCAGLDAIAIAAAKVASGQRRCVIAGGAESFSRAPLRIRTPIAAGEEATPYDRPPFSPFAENDPDMIEAAANLALAKAITRGAQEAYAIDSHRKARARPAGEAEIVPLAESTCDAFVRDLSPALCARLPALAGDPACAVTTATTAVEADAAAAVLIVNEEMLTALRSAHALRIVAADSGGGDPTMPGLAPIALAERILARHGLNPADLAAIEIMEAFAAQAIACRDAFAFNPERVNQGGGSLARGHPIGASGAILAVRLYHELRSESAGAGGLAMIAGAGGLGSVLMVSSGER